MPIVKMSHNSLIASWLILASWQDLLFTGCSALTASGCAALTAVSHSRRRPLEARGSSALLLTSLSLFSRILTGQRFASPAFARRAIQSAASVAPIRYSPCRHSPGMVCWLLSAVCGPSALCSLTPDARRPLTSYKLLPLLPLLPS